MSYKPAPSVEQMARELIKKHHPNLVNAPIIFRFNQDEMRSKGRVLLGKARKVSGLAAHLAGEITAVDGSLWSDTPFLVIEISEDFWFDDRTTEAQRMALVDHELCHCDWSSVDMKPFIVPHDIEEFTDVIRRHGLWNTGVFDFGQAAAEQLSLDIGNLGAA